MKAYLILRICFLIYIYVTGFRYINFFWSDWWS